MCYIFELSHSINEGGDSSVGIATGYGLDGPGIESGGGGGGARFSAPEAHPASYTMGTESFPGGVALTTHPI